MASDYNIWARDLSLCVILMCMLYYCKVSTKSFLYFLYERVKTVHTFLESHIKILVGFSCMYNGI